MHVTWLSVKWQCETQVLRDQRAARNRERGREMTGHLKSTMQEDRGKEQRWGEGRKKKEKKLLMWEKGWCSVESDRENWGGGMGETEWGVFSSVGHWQPSIRWVFNIEMPCFHYSRRLEIMTTIWTYGKSQSFSPFTLSFPLHLAHSPLPWQWCYGESPPHLPPPKHIQEETWEWVNVCVCVSVSVRERERKRETDREIEQYI